MRRQEVEVGKVYRAKVSGVVVPVRLVRAHHQGGWVGLNMVTNREVRVRTAARLRGEVTE